MRIAPSTEAVPFGHRRHEPMSGASSGKEPEPCISGDGKSARESRKRTGVKAAQFSLIGGSNALVDVGIFALLVLAWPTRSPEVLVAYNIAALGLANVNSYLWNTLWTFRRQADHGAKQVGLFTAQGIANVALGGAILWLVAHGLLAFTDLSPFAGGNVAKVVSMVVASTASFLFLRFFIFRLKGD